MDAMGLFDMERRTGIARDDVDEFAERMDLIAKAMEDIKSGTFDPVNCKIPGYKTPEQEEIERQEYERKEQERKKKEEEKKRQEKQEEHDKWWYKAELRHSLEQGDGDDEGEHDGKRKSALWANRVMAAYKTRDANDYSVWDSWVPEDPVSRQERADREAELEKIRNREFEANNPEFCNQFKNDLEERQRSQQEKERSAQKLKQKGNAYYKRKKYGEAIESYMKALDLAPFNVAVLANIAQCYLRQDNVEDCIEFCTRTLYIDPNHVKALSRRANVWHKQSKLKEAAEDMKKALVLDPENPDVIEQHSIVVGDYEDFAKKSFLEATIRGDSTCKQTLEVSAIQELRFVQEIFDQINKQVKNAEASSLMETEASDSELCTTSTSDVIQWQWAAYELLLPFVERSEDVRDHLRTSGELFRLCDRLCGVFGAVTLVAQNPSMNMSAKSKDRLESESIVSAMLNCVAATVADSSRNQVVLFRQTAFREYILEAVSKEHTDVVSGSDHRDLHNILASPLIQASIARVLEEVIDSKAWKNAVLSSRSCLNKLFEILKVEHVEKQMPKSHLVAITNRTISASSICFTLSNDAAGINTLVSSDDVGDRIIVMSKSIQAFSASDSPTLKNLLGLVTNLTTVEAFRVAIEAASRENERKLLVESLLSIAHRFFTVPVPAENSTSERALAALLNLSFHDYSQVRQKDLLEMNTIDVLLQMFANIQPEALPTSICVVSRASSLLCRLHVARYIADKTSKASECEEKLSSNPVLIELVRICKCIITSYKNPSEEIWQICAQIWCHFGWCAHLATVRSFLRQENAVSFLLKAIAVANDRSPYRNQLEPAKKNGSSTERLVGNIAKVLIALESDHTENDYTTFSKERNLGVLVTALQHLPDGLARKNVAILLAKLCQHDSSIKDTVRSLRGIEMMLSISQALQKTSGNTTARDPKALSA